MKQEKIRYDEVMALGFKRTDEHDDQYIAQYGFDYFIVELFLTKHVYIDWEPTTGFAKMIRMNKRYDIKAEYPIADLVELKRLVAFFKGEPNKNDTEIPMLA